MATNRFLPLLLLALVFALSACSKPPKEGPDNKTASTQPAADEGKAPKKDTKPEVKQAAKGADPKDPKPAPPASEPSTKPADLDAAKQVAAAKARLEKSEAGKLVLESINAHGGLDAWYAAGSLEFEFDYAPIGDATKRRYSLNRINLGQRQAFHKELGEGADATFAWDGQQTWIVPNAKAFTISPRFWALTPFYFVALPFVAADPGAVLSDAGEAKLGETEYKLVKVTFEAGVGDAPDDYYILYIDQKTKVLAGLRYVVSYPGFFPKGKTTPEKLMLFGKLREVGGLKLPGDLATYKYDPVKGQGKKVTNISVSKHAVGKPLDAKTFAAPKDAAILKGW